MFEIISEPVSCLVYLKPRCNGSMLIKDQYLQHLLVFRGAAWSVHFDPHYFSPQCVWADVNSCFSFTHLPTKVKLVYLSPDIIQY